MIDDEVDEHAYAPLLASVGELDEIPQRSVAGIYVVVVADVVSVVATGRRLKRHEPDCGDADALEIVETVHQAEEIADAVAVGVHEGGDRQAVDDGVESEVVDHERFVRITALGG